MSEYLPRLYELDETEETQPREEWPKENPFLKQPKTYDANFTVIEEYTEAQAVEKAAAALAECARVLVEKLTPTIKAIADTVTKLSKALSEVVLGAYPNPRVVHLAKYGHGRTKKKNIHRILKYYQRGAR